MPLSFGYLPLVKTSMFRNRRTGTIAIVLAIMLVLLLLSNISGRKKQFTHDHSDDNVSFTQIHDHEVSHSFFKQNNEPISREEVEQRAIKARDLIQKSYSFRTGDCFESSDSYKTASATRYAQFQSAIWREQPFNASNLSVKPHTYFIAINLHQNAAVLPDIILQLTEAIIFLGPDNVFVSIFENGSDDNTPNIIKTFDEVLAILGVNHALVTSDEHRPADAHRIEYLANVRNRAMEPLHVLFEDYGIRYESIIFLNDIFFCRDDILELIFQSRLQRSHITCSMDYDMPYEHYPLFYDTWVARDIEGIPLGKELGKVVSDPESSHAYSMGNPFQVYCCWNGMTVMDTAPFYETDIKFRRAPKGGDECAASECSLLCKDFWAHGYGRIVAVPRVKVAYEERVYRTLHNIEMQYPVFKKQDALFTEEESKEISFRKPPEHQFCIGLQKEGILTPDADAVWEPVPSSAFGNASLSPAFKDF